MNPAAGDEMSGGYFFLLLLLMTGVLDVGTTCGKAASGFWIDR